MSRDVSLTELLDRWRAGDQRAALAIYKRYAQRILCFAQPRINPKFHSRFNGEDIVATVLRTVLRRVQDGQYFVDSRGSMWNLVRKIAQNKIRKQAEFHQAGMRDIDKEVRGENAEEMIGTMPTSELPPEALAVFADELDGIRTKLKPRAFAVVDFRLQGYTIREISEELDCHYHTAASQLKWLRQWLLERYPKDGDSSD